VAQQTDIPTFSSAATAACAGIPSERNLLSSVTEQEHQSIQEEGELDFDSWAFSKLHVAD
jgi:hypothetical protein